MGRPFQKGRGYTRDCLVSVTFEAVKETLCRNKVLECNSKVTFLKRNGQLAQLKNLTLLCLVHHPSRLNDLSNSLLLR